MASIPARGDGADACSSDENEAHDAGPVGEMSLLADYNLPFTIAFAIMLALSLLQIVGAGDLLDFDADADVDVDAGVDAPGSLMAGVTTLLGIGRVPLFIWLVLFLLTFTVLGLGIQTLSQSLTGSPLYAWLAGVFAFAGAVPVTSVLSRPVGAMLPQDETSSVGLQSLVGRRATIAIGRASRGYAARAKVYDVHGHAHHVMVEPHEDSNDMQEGDAVLLVRREGQTFFAVPLTEKQLGPIV